MKEIVSKLIEIEKTTSAEKGKYDLFAVFLRENSFDKWDILVAASWISDNKEEALKYLAKCIQTIFSKDELLLISGIIIIDKTNPALPALQQTVHVEHGPVEIRDADFFGLQIKHAFLITSGKQAA